MYHKHTNAVRLEEKNVMYTSKIWIDVIDVIQYLCHVMVEIKVKFDKVYVMKMRSSYFALDKSSHNVNLYVLTYIGNL
jgi:hypothetical protein